MSTTSNYVPTGSLTFGSAPPTSTSQIDDDTYVVTSDGTSTGTPTALYKFDGETNAWVQIPLGGTSCPAPMTRAALIALRNAGGLLKDCDYVVTDFVQGRLLAGTLIHFQAVDASTLSMNVEVKTLFDNVAWAGIYDIDANRFLELQDSIGNIVRDSTSTRVTAFDWGNPAYTRCYIEDCNVIYTYGATQVTTGLRAIASSISLDGRVGGQIVDLDIIASSFSVSFSGASFTRTTITNQSSVSATGSPAASSINATKISGSTLTIGGATNQPATITFSSLSEQSSLNHNSTIGTFSLSSSSLSQSSLAHSGGNFSATGLQMQGGALSQTAAATGTFNATRVHLSSNAGISVSGANSVSFVNTSLTSSSSVSTGGTQALVVSGLTMSNTSTITIGTGVATTVSVTNTAFTTNATMTVTTVGNLLLDRVDSSNGTITKSGAGVLSITSTRINSGGLIAVQNVSSLTLNQSYVSNNSQIISNATGGSTDVVRWSRIEERARLLLNHTTNVNNFFSHVRVYGTSGLIQLTGANAGHMIDDTEVANSSLQISAIGQQLLSSVAITNSSVVNLTATVVRTLGRARIENSSTLAMSQNANTGAVMQQIFLTNQSTYNASGNSNCLSVVLFNNSTFNQTGGITNGFVKSMSSVFNSGFNLTNVYHHSNVSQTTTVSNTNRGRDLFNNNIV